MVGSEYNFDFLNRGDVEKLSKSFMKEKTVYALKETVFDSGTLETKVSRLRIIDIE
ncbi:hypothetical protein [Dehalobacterium formicoaceticum]|uniref:hypothetical protein n=1 Tax=Dehalobacterium formicoaceticum TaxID=51515 RepID=UPI0012F83687|nr:hypothetical protein [Dehalobacterium formicoaceticum]